MYSSYTVLFVIVLLFYPLGLIGLHSNRLIRSRHNFKSTRIPIPEEGLFQEPKWFSRNDLTTDINPIGMSANNTNSSIRLLPLFPFDYGLCYPSGDIPLNIFVMKFRMLANDIQKTDRMFGIVMSDGNGGLCEIGTCVENIKQELQPDGKQLLYNVCQQRFKILDIVQEEPYLIAKVQCALEDTEVLEAKKANIELPDNILFLEQNAFQLMIDIVALSNKLIASRSTSNLVNKQVDISDKIKQLSPIQLPSRLQYASDFSFALCDMLNGSTSPLVEQLLLESESLELRLRRLCSILSETRIDLMSRVEIADEPFN